MKNTHNILFASAVGLIATLGFLALRRYLNTGHLLSYHDEDEHLHFYEQDLEDSHGIEFYAVR